MKKDISLTATMVVFFIILTSIINAQENNDRSWGISAAIHDAQIDLQFPIWAGSKNVIAPAIGVINIGGSGTDLRIGLVDRIFLNTDENIKPFLGGRAGVLLAIPDNGDPITDYIVGLLGGGEYFFSANFSVGIEGQLNISISDENSSRFGNPKGTNVNTASVIFATIYF